MKLLFKLAGPIVLVILLGLALVDGNSVNLSSNWIPFLGRFHPVLLHLPIGLFAGVVLLEVYVMLRPVSRVPEKIHFLLTTAFYTTAITAILGIFLSWEGGYEAEALDLHKWGGIATAAAFLALDWLLKNRADHPEKLPTTYLTGLVFTIGLISITGHLGGSLTHGSGFLTEFNPFAKKAEIAEHTADTPVYVSHIQPILQDYCVQCHSPEKMKGELRLDTFEMIMAGGLNGPAIVPGDSKASRLIHAIHLPLDEDEHMPPKGKPQPNEEVVQLLSWWIDQGASPTARLEDLEVTSDVAVHFLEVDVLELQSREEMQIHMDGFASRSNLSVIFIAQIDDRVSVRGRQATDEDLEALLPMKSNIAELNLAGSSVTDKGMNFVGQMTNLTHLDLNNTAVTDAGIEQLANLYQLEYINLYGTPITDDALLVLRRLKNLKKIFLWGTGATREAIADLRKSLFRVVESDKLRIQIDELSKKRASLEVDIVSAFDMESQALNEKPEAASKPKITIADVMIRFHKGSDSNAVQAREGRADPETLKEMLENYRAIALLAPPKGTLEDWKKRTAELIEATSNLVTSPSKQEAVDRYKAAVDCKACHSSHRPD